MHTATIVFALIGALFSLYVVVGITLDVTSLDPTTGGYEPPYEGWSGDPVDWDSMDQTSTGLVKRGHVIDVHIHGTTGMMKFGVLGFEVEWQTPSERALVVHRPREALARRGFHPEF